MNSNSRKILLTIVAIVAALALVWLLILRDDGQNGGDQNQPEATQVEAEQTETDTTEPQVGQPQTALGAEAASVLDSYREILGVQQQYTDTCPPEAIVAEVTNKFNLANEANAILNANILASDDPQAVEEAQPHLREIEALIELSATLGPEIVERCNIAVPTQ